MVTPELALLGALLAVEAGVTQDELDMLVDRLVLGRSLESTARGYGCTRSNVGQRLQSARLKLQRSMAVAA